MLFRQTPRFELPANYTAISIPLNDGLEIKGYQLEQSVVEIGQETTVTIVWESELPSAQLFLHLVDEKQSLIAQDDVHAISQPEGLTLTQFRLTPRSGAADFTLYIGSGSERFELDTIFATVTPFPPATLHPVYRPVVNNELPLVLVGYDWDNTLPGKTRLYYHWQRSEGYFSTAADTLATHTMADLLAPWGIPQSYWIVPQPQPDDHYVPLGQGIVWVGNSLTDLNTAVFPNNQYPLPMQFLNGRPLLRDYVVSTRLVGYEADGFTWAWCDLVDGIPAMGGIPTLKWIDGSQVQSPRTVVFPPRTEPATFTDFCRSEKPAPDMPVLHVDNNAIEGQTVGGILRLYDAFTNRPLPILDERITAVYSWIPLGETTISE